MRIEKSQELATSLNSFIILIVNVIEGGRAIRKERERGERELSHVTVIAMKWEVGSGQWLVIDKRVGRKERMMRSRSHHLCACSTFFSAGWCFPLCLLTFLLGFFLFLLTSMLRAILILLVSWCSSFCKFANFFCFCFLFT